MCGGGRSNQKQVPTKSAQLHATVRTTSFCLAKSLSTFTTARYIAVICSSAMLYRYLLRWELALDIAAQGPVEQLCVEVVDFVMESAVAPYWHRTYFGAVRTFAHECVRVFQELDLEQRDVLQTLGTPLPDEVLRHSVFRLPWGQWWAPNRSQDELREQLTLDSPRASLHCGLPAQAFIARVQGNYQGMAPPWLEHFLMFEQHGGPCQEDHVEPDELLGAMQEGRPVRFVAKRFLPASVFNVTLRDIAAAHGLAAGDIPILGTEPATRCRRDLAWKYKRLWLAGESTLCPPHYTLAMAARERAQTAHMVDYQPPFWGARVNVRRLPHYVNLDADVVRPLGLEGDVERATGQLNIGYSAGEPHWDEQDNLFINIKGVSVVMVAPSNYTDAADGYKGSGFNMPWWVWQRFELAGLAHERTRRNHTFRRDVMPYFAVVLLPGEGVLIPSRSYHAVMGTFDRIALNAFLEPRYGRMRWPSNPGSHWHRETPERRAVRNLWTRTIARLWDERKLSIHIQGYNLEML